MTSKLLSSGSRTVRSSCLRSPRPLTFEIEPLGDLAKLTMIHDGFAPGSVVLPGISDGWPRVLAGLKTLLETGETLPAG
jgi:hypothetical protein